MKLTLKQTKEVRKVRDTKPGLKKLSQPVLKQTVTVAPKKTVKKTKKKV